MAIKTVSQLERFNNNSSENSSSIGGNLHQLSAGLLTVNDKNMSPAYTGDGSEDGHSYSQGRAEIANPNNLPTDNDTYWKSLFEISKPNVPGSEQPNSYDSYSVTYLNILQNILCDVKAFLNWHNNLNDYNLSAIVEGNQMFKGKKTFNNDVNVLANLSVGNDLSIGNDTYAQNCLYANEISVSLANIVSLSVTNNISSTNSSAFFYGYCSALASVDNNGVVGKLNCGTAKLCSEQGQYVYRKDHTVVVFKDGKPAEANEIDYAHHAFWSDLGEKYLADAEYEPGTLVKFGGEKEITIADTEVNAIVSTKAFDLNNTLKDGTVICLCGRVPTKVIGKISKFDKIMLSTTPGVACKWDGVSRTIGRALESSEDEGIKLVECVSRFEV